MSQKPRRKVTCYLPDELADRYQDLAGRKGVSLSAFLVENMTVKEQIDELHAWMMGRFNRIEELLGRLAMPHTEDAFLSLIGLQQLPREAVVGILRDIPEEAARLTPKQLEQYAAKGRELLARSNGKSR
jgi:hypothetical protein